MKSANVITDQLALIGQIWSFQAVHCLIHQRGHLELDTASAGSQCTCSSRKTGVICVHNSHQPARVTSLAAAF